MNFSEALSFSAQALRASPIRSLLTGKVRPTGKLRMLARAPKLFG